MKEVIRHKTLNKLRPSENYSPPASWQDLKWDIHCESGVRILIDDLEKDRIENDGANNVCLKRTEFVWVCFALFFTRVIILK